MASPVRLRGEVGERRLGQETIRFNSFDREHYYYYGNESGLQRRRNNGRRNGPESTEARVDEIVAHFKAALAELQEQSRADRAEVAGLRDEIARLHDVIAKAARTIERRDADPIRYAAAGECEG